MQSKDFFSLFSLLKREQCVMKSIFTSVQYDELKTIFNFDIV